MTLPCALRGKGVLVTRPVGQAGGLCRLIEQAGGRAIPFPTIAILPAVDPEPTRRLLAEPWDLLIFISRNAVEHALPLFPGGQLPPGPRLAALGRATAEALTDAGRAPDLVPAGRYDSDSLLALPDIAKVAGQRVLIVRGEGGRALLGDTLIERAAQLAYAEVYRRTRPEVDPAELLARWRRDVAFVTATSDEILLNLWELLGARGHELLLATPLVVVSERTAQTAGALGVARVVLADHAADEAMLAALCRLA